MESDECAIYETSFNMHRYDFIDGSVFLPEKFSILLSDGEVIALGYNECMALCTLLEYPDEFVVRKLLIQNIWGNRGVLVDENSLNQCISRLRKQINQTILKKIVHIETLPKVGYKIEISNNLSTGDALSERDSTIKVLGKISRKFFWFIILSLIAHLLMVFYHDELVGFINEEDVISIIIKDNKNIERRLRINGKAMMVYCAQGTMSSEKNACFYNLNSN